MTDGLDLADLMRNAVDCLESYMIGIREIWGRMPDPSDADALKAKADACLEEPVLFIIPVSQFHKSCRRL